MKLSHRDRTGFTLIELLVVITIISILAAMLFPVFGRIRKKALGAKSASNLKQLTLATLVYAAENDNMLPQGTGAAGSWDTQLMKYGVTTNLLRAPLHKYGTRHYWVNGINTSGAATAVMGANCSASLAALNKPANTFAIMEMRDDDYKFSSKWVPGNTTEGWGFLVPLDRATLKFNYNDFAPFSFCDGHVEMLRLSAVSANSWEKFRRDQ